jgi:hypothetical protein
MKQILLLTFMSFTFLKGSAQNWNYLYSTSSDVTLAFSEVQSAKTIGKNRVEITPFFSSAFGKQNYIGFQFAYGISNDIDIRFRFESMWIKEGEISKIVSVFGIGPKFSLLKDNISFYIPIGSTVGEGTKNTWQIHPTLLFTLPIVKDLTEVSLSTKYLLPICEDCDNSIAVNLGFSLSSNLSKWAIRPEYGMLFYPGGSGYFSQFSLGYSIIFGD